MKTLSTRIGSAAAAFAVLASLLFGSSANAQSTSSYYPNAGYGTTTMPYDQNMDGGGWGYGTPYSYGNYGYGGIWNRWNSGCLQWYWNGYTWMQYYNMSACYRMMYGNGMYNNMMPGMGGMYGMMSGMGGMMGGGMSGGY